MKGINFRGIQIGSVELYVESFSFRYAIPDAIRFRQMMAFIAEHVEGTRPVVAKVFPFEEAREAYEYLEAGGHMGKVVIRVAKS